MSTKNDVNNLQHLPWLDGLRGIAALWVMLSHIQILSGLRSLPVLSWGNVAVDLFMMLSGFLMAHHYVLRQDKEPWNKKNTAFTFWIRRFFRIAPLYYVLLIAAFLFGPQLGDFRDNIAALWPSTATDPDRYNDQTSINLITHISFVFGLLPDFSFRTALPDWSIGLEMLFYLVFPLVMYAMGKFGALKVTLILVILCVMTQIVFSEYVHSFPMPSFLPLKLNIFMAGIWMAIGRSRHQMNLAILVAIALCFVSLVNSPIYVVLSQSLLIISLFFLMNDGSLNIANNFPHSVERLRRILSSKFAVFLGDTSYAVYLLHLMIVLPIAGTLAAQEGFGDLNQYLRFFMIAVPVLPLTYFIAWVLYNAIEKNGINLGKRLLKTSFLKS